MRVFKISIVTLLVCFISISLRTVAFAQHSVLQLKPNNNSENLKSPRFALTSEGFVLKADGTLNLNRNVI